MCQQCIDACNEYWPHLTTRERTNLLWGATCYGAGTGEQVATQLRDLAKWCGGSVAKALWFAEQEMDFCVQNNWRYLWPLQYAGVSDFDFFDIGRGKRNPKPALNIKSGEE